METQTLINFVVGTACAAAGWWLRVLWEAQQSLQKDLGTLEKDLPKTYVLKADYKSDIEEIKTMLGRIFDRLDGKVDK